MWTYNCVRAYVGNYVGGGTNEFERSINCRYEVVKGDIITKRLRPVRVKGTNSEVTIFTLQTLAIYPKADMAIIVITNSKGSHKIRLSKTKKGERSSILKASL
jgi:hypothetical protein